MVLLIIVYLMGHHTMTTAQTQNISFTSFRGCLDQNLSLHTCFNCRHPYRARDLGGGGDPGTGLYEDSPADEKRLHLTSAQMCMFEDSGAAPEFFGLMLSKRKMGDLYLFYGGL